MYKKILILTVGLVFLLATAATAVEASTWGQIKVQY